MKFKLKIKDKINYFIFIIILVVFLLFFKKIQNFTVGSQVNSSIEGGVGAQENYDSSILNVYGESLQRCRTGSKSGSSINGYCKEDTGGLHQICFDVNDDTDDFSLETGQSNWSEGRNGNFHCMCLGAWALYKAKNKGTGEELDCDAIPEYSLSTDYIKNWNTWNGNEYLESNGKPRDQIIDGVDSLVEQCYNKDNLSDDKKEYLKELYDNIRLSYGNWNSIFENNR